MKVKLTKSKKLRLNIPAVVYPIEEVLVVSFGLIQKPSDPTIKKSLVYRSLPPVIIS